MDFSRRPRGVLLSLLLLTAVPPAVSASLPPLRMEVIPPPALSPAAPEAVRILLESSSGETVRLVLRAEEEGGPAVSLGSRTLTLPGGVQVVEWPMDPSSLAAFPLPTDLTLRAEARLSTGEAVEAEAETTLTFAPETRAGWGLFFSARPLLVYTGGPSSVALAVNNPSGESRRGEIRLTFLDERKRKRTAAGRWTLTFPPGWSEAVLSVPPSVTARAASRGNVQAKAALRVGGVLKARDFAPLDYDLALSAAATPGDGEAPLEVHFSAAASGGTAPYEYRWTFGDGEEASGAEVDHRYLWPGTYEAVATVTDALGGRLTVPRLLAVRPSPLTVSCEAAPYEGPAPLTVSFSASASGGYGVYDYAWSFGDGGTSLERAPTHTYAAPGTYTATVTVLSGALRESCSRTVTAALPVHAVHASAGPGGSVSPSGTVSVPQGGSLTIAITPDPGFHVADVLVDGVSAGALSSYTFSDVQADHTLEARFAQTTYTVTTSAGPGGSVSPAGTVVLPVTETLEVRIQPAARFRIFDVQVDGVSRGAVGSVLLAGPEDHTVAAFFERTHHLVTATAGSGGRLTPSGEVEVPVGGLQTFQWTADPGFHLEALLVDGVSVGTPPGYTFEDVRADHTLEARFARNTFTIYATFTAGGTVLPNGNVTVFEGEDQTFTITPNPGFVTKEVVVDGVSIAPSRSHTFLAVDRDHYFHVVFEATTPRSHQITTLAGPGGSISPSGLVLVGEGSDITFTVTPDPGHHTTDVLVDGASVGPVSSYTFTNVQANHTLAAFFAPDAPLFTVTCTAGPGGSVSPSGTVSVPQGGNLTVTVTPNPGFHIEDVMVDGVSVGPVSSYTFTDVQANHTLHASFAADTVFFTVTCTAGPGGSVSPSGTVSVPQGGSLTVTVTPNPGFHVEDVLVDGTSVGPVSSYTFTNVQAGHILSAFFAADPNEPPVIAGLAADPEAVPAGTGTSTLTFTLTDPEGGAVTWSAQLSGSTSTGDLGALVPAGGTVASGTLVTLTYSAEKVGTGSVTVTVSAVDSGGAAALPQAVTLTLL